jgi:hypothetical protein
MVKHSSASSVLDHLSEFNEMMDEVNGYRYLMVASSRASKY